MVLAALLLLIDGVTIIIALFRHRRTSQLKGRFDAWLLCCFVALLLQEHGIQGDPEHPIFKH